MKKVFKLYLMLFLSITGTVFTTNAETKKILVVGNSFSFDAALQEFLPIVQAAGDDIVLGFPYKGGTTLELHTNYVFFANSRLYGSAACTINDFCILIHLVGVKTFID